MKKLLVVLLILFAATPALQAEGRGHGDRYTLMHGEGGHRGGRDRGGHGGYHGGGHHGDHRGGGHHGGGGSRWNWSFIFDIPLLFGSAPSYAPPPYYPPPAYYSAYVIYYTILRGGYNNETLRRGYIEVTADSGLQARYAAMGVLGCDTSGHSLTDPQIRCEINHIQQR